MAGERINNEYFRIVVFWVMGRIINLEWERVGIKFGSEFLADDFIESTQQRKWKDIRVTFAYLYCGVLLLWFYHLLSITSSYIYFSLIKISLNVFYYHYCLTLRWLPLCLLLLNT